MRFPFLSSPFLIMFQICALLATGTTFYFLPELLLEYRTSYPTIKTESMVICLSDLIAQRACFFKSQHPLRMRQISVFLFPERT